MPKAREQFTISSIDDVRLREQLEARRKSVAQLDAEIADFLANAEGMYINMKTFSDAKGKTLAKRVGKTRDRIQSEIDALQSEVDRRASALTTT